MASLAAHLVDDVLGGLPVRQWVLTTPQRLRYALAYDQRLCRGVLAVFIRAVLAFERRRARRRGGGDGHGGAVTAIQRFGSAANLSVISAGDTRVTASSPQNLHVVLCQPSIVRHQRQAFSPRLCDEHTVEWIRMVGRELGGSLSVRKADR